MSEPLPDILGAVVVAHEPPIWYGYLGEEIVVDDDYGTLTLRLLDGRHIRIFGMETNMDEGYIAWNPAKPPAD